MSGIGGQPFGSSSYSLGTPAITDGSPGEILYDPDTGRSEGSRYINPATRDFQLDASGRLRGQLNVRHLVQMAIQTAKGSAAVRELGFDTSDLDVITSDTERRLSQALEEAVAHLVAANLIVSLGVTRYRAGPSDGLVAGRVYSKFNWRDVATGEEFGEPI